MHKDESDILDYPPDKKEIPPVHPLLDRIMRSGIFLSISGIILGILFRIQHWNGGSTLLIISCITLTACGILRYLLRTKKKFSDYLLIAVFAFFPPGYLFTIMHWQHAGVIWLAGRIALLVYLVYSGWNRFIESNK